MKKTWLYLLFSISILCLVGAMVLKYYWSNTPPIRLDEKYTKVIQSNVLKELDVLYEEGKRIKRTFQDNNNTPLVALSEQLKYDFYIFKNEQLVFWSDYRFVPSYNNVAGLYKVRYTHLANGQHIVHRTSFVTGGGSLIEIYSLLPIYYRYQIENVYVQSQYNQELIVSKNIELVSKDKTIQKSSNHVYSDEGTYLFSVQPTEQYEAENKYLLVWSLVLFVLSTLLGTIVVVHWRKALHLNRQHEYSFIVFAVFLLSYRWILLTYNTEIAVFGWDLFNPKLYASSQWSPSLGDLLLNLVLFLVLLIDLSRLYYKSKLYYRLLHSHQYVKLGAGVLLAFMSYILLEEHFYTLSTIYLHSQINLDISQEISFPLLKIVCIIIFILISAIYFLGINLLTRLFIRINTHQLSQSNFVFMVGSILYNLFSFFSGTFSWLLVLVNGIFFLSCVYLLLPKFLYRFRYLTSIYLFLGALVCAVSGAYSIYRFGENRSDINKKKYAEALLDENDLYTEFILEQINQQLEKDATIKQAFLSPLTAYQDLVRQKVRRVYINNSLESYQIDILLFDLVGNSLNEQNKATYKDFVNKFQKSSFETTNPYIYFVSETDAVEGNLGVNLLKEYVSFIPIEKENALIGHIIIDLKQKKDIPNNVYPELLIDKRFKQPKETKYYSYAVYSNQKLLYSYGNYNYEKDFRKNFLRFSSLYTKGYHYNGFKHIGVLGDNNRVVVISSDAYSNKKIFANFSFLFLSLLVAIIVVILAYSAKNQEFRIKSTYATRIQIYLNIAFFLPLIVVSVVTLSLVSNTYEMDLKNAFIKKAQSASNSIVGTLQGFKSGRNDQEKLNNDLAGVAKYSETDINLFDPEGKLVATSQPSIYESGFLSSYANPNAYAAIVEQKEKNLMLLESVGSLKYRSVYVAVRSFENNELLGILSIPFFDAEDEQDKKIINILSTIMNIFTATFIVFLIVSYFASRILTVPLSLITQKIRKTSLQNVNEPLEWDSEDEIGLLVSEYNRMLVNLEQNKQALSQSEKESAWREMAKQVAHEIKNPLTPMKLSLQHLQFKLQKEFIEIKPIIDKPFETILTQIDTLSDIATSFSNFAKMPIPKNEPFDLAKTLRSTVRLHRDTSNKQIILHIAKGSYMVNGDEQLMSRIITNLILNAVQAVPQTRFPEVYINLYVSPQRKIQLEIRDNGLGIPKDIQDQIFVPNFSTKFTGSGIGLALAKRGIEHAGGSIWFETRENEGTCFFIELPQGT